MSEQIESATIYATVRHGMTDGEFWAYIVWPSGASTETYYWDD